MDLNPNNGTPYGTAANKKNAKSSSSTSSNRIGLVHGVTRENWPLIARQFIGANGGFVLGLEAGEVQGVPIPQTPRQWGAWRAYFKKKGIPTTFMDAKAKATAENRTSVNPHCWTVPAEWPHMFDAEATVQEDHEAGNWFMRNWRPPNPQMADAAQRAITAAASRRWQDTRNATPQTFQPFPALWEAFHDEQHILQGHRFEVYEEASRKLAMYGKDDARKTLMGGYYTDRRKVEMPDVAEEPKGQFIDRDKLLEGYERDMAELNARAAKKVQAAE